MQVSNFQASYKEIFSAGIVTLLELAEMVAEASRKSAKVNHADINWVCYKGKEVHSTGVIDDPSLNSVDFSNAP